MFLLSSFWSKFHLELLLVLSFDSFCLKRLCLEIQKLKIPSPEFYPISWDLGELRIPNVARMSLMKRQLIQKSFVLVEMSWKLLFVFVFRRRPLDVFKTSFGRRICSNISEYFRHTSSRRFEDVFEMSSRNVFMNFSRLDVIF